MPPQPLRAPRLLILIGYVVLTVGTALTVWGERGDDPYYPRGLMVFDLASVISVALLGSAWWSTFSALQLASVPPSLMHRSFRIFAAVSGVLALGNVALIRDVMGHAIQVLGYESLFKEIYELPDSRPLYKGLVVTVLGLCLIAAGFWRASGAFSRPVPDPSSDDELVGLDVP